MTDAHANLPVLDNQELADLRVARRLLENPSFAMRLANRVGSPIEAGLKMLPSDWNEKVQKAAQKALMKALQVAVSSLGKQTGGRASPRMHQLMAGATGAIGGVFGMGSLLVELPVSTTIMLRSIADIARSEGHHLDSWPTRLACLEVFALGGTTTADDASDNAYWAVRLALSGVVEEAVSYLAGRGAVERSAPVILRLVSAIAARFGLVVSEQAAAKAIPILGAAAGSTINVVFTSHFQNMARGHFIVRRLEAKYGMVEIHNAYANLDSWNENSGCPPVQQEPPQASPPASASRTHPLIDV